MKGSCSFNGLLFRYDEKLAAGELGKKKPSTSNNSYLVTGHKLSVADDLYSLMRPMLKIRESDPLKIEI